MGRACCYIMYQTNKKGNISIDVSVSLCYNYSDQTIKTKQQTKQGSIIKVFPPLCLKGFKNMITQDIIKINSFENFSFNDVLLSVSDNLQSAGLSEGLGIYTENMNHFRKIRSEQYSLQDKARRLLSAHTLMGELKAVKACFRAPINESLGGVSVYKSKTNQKAFYGGLKKCSNVWSCPVCSHRIQTKRAQEISQALWWAYHNGYKAIMITTTHPHHRGQDISENINLHRDAMARFKRGKQFTLFKQRVGYIGSIKANEITYGDNGAHFHTHSLWIVSRDCNIESEKDFLSKKWFNACKKAGFDIPDESAFNAHSVDVMDDCHASQYLAKTGLGTWGADKEMARGASKKGHGKTAFDLLRSDDEQDNLLYVEHARALRGVRQIVWSRGLKSLVGVSDKSDEELNEQDEQDNSDLIASIGLKDWRIVLREQARSEILEIAEQWGSEGVALWLWFAERERQQYNE